MRKAYLHEERVQRVCERDEQREGQPRRHLLPVGDLRLVLRDMWRGIAESACTQQRDDCQSPHTDTAACSACWKIAARRCFKEVLPPTSKSLGRTT